MSSSRLPGKILADIAGQPMLTRVFTRTSRATTLDEVIFATTTDASDDPVAEYCDFSGIPFTRGSLFDDFFRDVAPFIRVWISNTASLDD